MPGHHNALNATAAIAVAYELKAPVETIRRALAGFGGVKRRFTRTGEWNGVAIFDDYGHHPVEIAAVLRAARASTKDKVIAIVQPHRYTRLQSLFEQFASCFNDADTVIVADVYPAGEAPIEGADKIGARGGDQRAWPSPRAGARRAGRARRPGARNRPSRRLRRVSRRRQYHPMGLCAARRAGGGRRPRRERGLILPDIVPDIARADALACAASSPPMRRWRPIPGFASAARRRRCFSRSTKRISLISSRVCPLKFPSTIIGLGSNLIVRDGGIAGVVIRLGGKAFGAIEATADYRVTPGSAAPDVKVARAAAEAGVAGLAFFRGIPGSIGGALRMNAGAHGGETRDLLVEARGVDRSGAIRTFSAGGHGFFLSPFERAGGCDLHPGDFSGAARRPRRDSRADGADHRRARSLAADSRKDRRLDLQEPARRKGLGADRQSGLPRTGRSATRRSRRCIAIF